MKHRHWLWISGLSVILMGVNAWALAPDKDARSQSLPMQPGISRSAVGVNYRTISSGRPAVYVPRLTGATAYAPTMDQENTIKTAEQSGVTVERHSRLGLPVSVRGTDLGQRKAYSRGKGLTMQDGGKSGRDALAVVDNLSGVFGIQNAPEEFAVKPVERDGLGYAHTRLDQRYKGLRVVGGQLITHFNQQGKAYEVNGRYIPGIEADVTPGLSSEEAIEIARADLEGMGKPSGDVVQEPELVIFAWDNEPQLAYELTLGYQDTQAGIGVWRYWINAHDGHVILEYNDVKTSQAAITGNILTGEGGGVVSVIGDYDPSYYYAYALFNKSNGCWNWAIENAAASGYVDNNSLACRSTSNWGDSDRAEMSAAKNIDLAQAYYRQIHNRPGYKDIPYNGGNPYDNYLYLMVHMPYGGSTNWVNAAWIGGGYNQIWIGDGDGRYAAPLGVLDVCGHEFTHGVTEYSANLYYYSESGALNESFSDIFGTCLEFHAQPDGRSAYPGKTAGTADWLCGEDCWLSSTALRDLKNPANTVTVGAGNEQPTRYKGTYWYNGGGDNGGVHYNSGVQNFFFYLLSEGGRGTNDGISYNVAGIGVTNAEKIAYRALTVYCWEFTDYAEAGGAWRSAANDLNPAWTANVDAAWNAVYRPVTNNYAPWYTGGYIYSCPAIADDGTIYVGSCDGNLYAFNSSGVVQRTWKMAKGTVASPALAPDGTIYIGAEDGRFYSFNPNGTTNHIWTTDRSVRVMADFDAAATLGQDGKIYIGASDHCGYCQAEPPGTFYAFNPNGTTAHVWAVEGAIYASAAIDTNGVIYVGDALSNGDGHLYAFNPDGTTKWKLGIGGWVNSPIIGRDGTIYIGAWNNRLYAVSPNGNIKHTCTLDSFPYFSSPVIGPDDSIYITTYLGTLYSFSPDGHTNHTWGPVSNGFWASTPAIGSDGSIYVGEHVSRLWAFNANGTTNKMYTTDSFRIYSSPTISSNGTVYIGGLDKKLYALAGTGGALANSVWPKKSKNLRNSGADWTTNTNPIPPSAPTGVSASDGTYTEKVRVSWNAASGATGYIIWRYTSSSSGSATQIGSASGVTYDDPSAGAGTVYYYWVKAVNSAGSSGFSQPDTGYRSTGGGQAPSPPTGISASDGTYTDKVRISWDAVVNASMYFVFRNSTGNTNSAAMVGTASSFSTFFNDTNAVAGTIYYYWVRVFVVSYDENNPGGLSGFSTSDTGYRSGDGGVQTPSAPTGVSASDGTYTNKVRVSWNAVSGALYYHVYRNTVNDSGTAQTLGFDSAATTCDDTTATASVTYYYWVKAGNMSGESGFSAPDIGYRSASGGGQAPSVPTGISASDGIYPDKVHVNWNASANATAYEVWRSTANNSGSAGKLADASATIYDDQSATDGTIYYYWIKARNSSGSSGFSASDSGYRANSPPSAPTGMSASDGTYTNKVRVTWNAVSGATGYTIWRHTNPSSASASRIGSAGSAAYDDTSAVAGTVYYYWVKATNNAGTSGFSSSDSGYRAEPQSPPSAPTGISASDGTYTNKVRVNWKSVAGTTSYEVWRNTSNNSAGAVKISDTSSPVYDDISVTAGLIYYYWIKASNSYGSSGFSNPDRGYRSGGQPPSAPTDVTASDGTYRDKVKITWEVSPDAIGYEVWRYLSDLSGFAVKIADTDNAGYDDTSAAVNTAYYYWIKAKNVYGSSGFSSPDTGFVGGATNYVIEPEIRINNSDAQQIALQQGNQLALTISMRTSGTPEADWWIFADTPVGLYYYNSADGLWHPTSLDSLDVTYQGPLFDFFTPYEVLNMNTLWLPPGTYIFYFGVDVFKNGRLDFDALYYKSVTLTIAD